MRRPIRRLTVLLVLLGAGVAAGAWAGMPPATAAAYRPPPTGRLQWYWELDPPRPGLAGLPAVQAPYPKPGSADVWDTDLFQDSNRPGAGIPTGPSPVVRALHAAGRYSICYVEAGAYQTSFPDRRDFAPADYGHGARPTGCRAIGASGGWTSPASRGTCPDDPRP